MINDDVVIRVENLSKEYDLIHQDQERYSTLRDTIVRGSKQALTWANPFTLSGKFRRSLLSGKTSKEEYWALKDVSFEIKRGERVGVIGRNGAGKSTLLKILSRITEPTKGRIQLKGRVASLLEVGTGFHPELTGRENIYLNGAILGMSRREIRRKFDEIVAFAEVEKFLDTPVKRYSSGMYVRLAFAVAAHLEPDIMVVDEVLAVGDQRFQKRCLGKMDEVTEKEGRTILFVSHSMSMIASLCPRSLLLEQGRLKRDGTSSEVIFEYQGGDLQNAALVNYEMLSRLPGDELANLLKGWIEDRNGNTTSQILINEECRVCMVYRINQMVPGEPSATFKLIDNKGDEVFITSSQIDMSRETSPGIYEAKSTIPPNFLNDCLYSIALCLTFYHSGFHMSFLEKDALTFTVVDPIENVPTRQNTYSGPYSGIVRPLLDWHVRKIG